MIKVFHLLKKHQSMLLLFFTALILRVVLIPLPPFKIDMDAWVAWSYRLFELGLSSFYSPDVWTNYTPGYLYLLWILSIIRVIFSFEQQTLIYLIKLLSITFELLLPLFVIYKLPGIKEHKGKLLIASLLLFNPATIFNSAIWGQIDGILTFFLFLAIYFLLKNKPDPKKSSFSYAYALLIKPQSLAIAPLFLVDLIHKRNLKQLRTVIFPGISLFFLLCLPFFIHDPLFGIFKLIFQMSQDYPATSLFAYNFWGIEGFWLDDLRKIGPFTFRTLGTFFYLCFIVFVIYLGLKKKANYFALAALLTLAFYFLPTRVHERYLYPAIPFLFIYATIIKNKTIIFLTSILSIVYFLSQYYVYVYYNEIYLKLNQIFYQQSLYTFLDTNGKILSLISSLIFIMIVWQVTKSIYDHQDTKT